MMPDWRAKVRNFIKRNLIMLITVVLAGLFTIGAGWLRLGEISYLHPGPAIAAAGLAFVVLIIGLVMNDLQAQNRNVSQEVKQLQEVISDLQAQNQNLSAEVTRLQEKLKQPIHLPRVIGLDILVNRWQAFKPELDDNDRAKMYDQLLIAQQIFNRRGTQRITFIKAFPGSKLEGGAFLVQPENMEAQVLKFDRIENLRRERQRFDSCVQGRLLTHAPGRPIDYWPPQSTWDHETDGRRGAIVYNLAQMGADSKQQTFGQYYAEQDASRVEQALNHILSVLAPNWWRNHIHLNQDTECPRKSANPNKQSLYYEYKRLKDKLDALEQCWQAVCIKMGKLVVNDPNDEHFFYLRDEYLPLEVRLRNPIQWVHATFADQDTFNQQYGDLENIRRDSIVHGDFHAGNILIEEDQLAQRIWLIDFPHTHVGPTVQDIARLEADIKFGLLPSDELAIHDLYHFEAALLPQSAQQPPPIAALKPEPQAEPTDPRLLKAWNAVCILRNCVLSEHYLHGNDTRPYYLALLHATLPVLCFDDRSDEQKLYAFLAAALLCERLS